MAAVAISFPLAESFIWTVGPAFVFDAPASCIAEQSYGSFAVKVAPSLVKLKTEFVVLRKQLVKVYSVPLAELTGALVSEESAVGMPDKSEKFSVISSAVAA